MPTDTETKKLSEAKIVYRTLCSSLDNRKWNYHRDDDEFVVTTSAVGDDLTINLFIKVDAKRSVMFLKSPLPFAVTSGNKQDILECAAIANWAMLNGSFEIDLDEGYIGFKTVVPFMDSLISEHLCKYMIDMSCRMVDVFNDKLQAVARGTMSVADFADFAKKAI